MTRFYVAGKWEEREQVKVIMQTLEAKGHKITCDWTVHEYDNSGYPVGYAIDDVQGVQCADIYVGVFINENRYRGALVEMGVALGLNKEVYIIGHAIDSCMFIYHPLVRQFDTVDEFLEWLEL